MACKYFNETDNSCNAKFRETGKKELSIVDVKKGFLSKNCAIDASFGYQKCPSYINISSIDK